jgi:antitoxin ParD1/3/4
VGKDTNTKSIHATVTPELDSFVNKLVDTGRFTSQSEAVRAALRLLEDKERLREVKLEALKEKIREGLESGPASTLDIEEIKKAARTAWEGGNSVDSYGSGQ